MSENAIPDEIRQITSSMREILDSFLGQISNAARPHTLDELARELRPKMAAVIGGRKAWYEHIEEGEGLHGEVLSPLSQEYCDKLAELELQLSQKVSPFLLGKGVGGKILRIYSTGSLSDRRKAKFAEQLHRTLEEITEKVQDIEAQTHGFVDRTREDTAYHPLEWQILTAYDLANTLKRAERELLQVAKWPAPSIASIEVASEVMKRLDGLGITTVTQYMSDAYSKLVGEQYPECCHESRKALEETIVQVANLLTKKPARRKFKDALEVVKTQLQIPEDTSLTLAAKDVGLYGWLSIKGGHSESTIKGQEAQTPHEARLAINWTLSAITMVVDVYEATLANTV